MIDVAPFIGAKFADKGRGPDYDCLGLVRDVNVLNYGSPRLPDFGERYADTSDWQGIGNCIEDEKTNWVEIEEPVEGAVIVFAIGGRPHHIGICTGFQGGEPWFLHIYEGNNAEHLRLSDSVWKSRIEAMYLYD